LAVNSFVQMFVRQFRPKW